jgi:hypothetical protein
MNTPNPKTPRDEDIDALLARRYRDTSPAFEARWVALKRDLRNAPVRRRWWSFSSWNSWVMFSGVAAALVMVLAFATWRREGSSPVAPVAISPALAELFAMEEVLGRATPLLDAENREALLHLPVQPQPRT